MSQALKEVHYVAQDLMETIVQLLVLLNGATAYGDMAILANKPAYKATPHPYSRPNLLSVLAGLQASI